MSYGLLIDYEYCTGCHTCEVACQMEHGLAKDRFGIKIAETGPWNNEGDKWQWSFVPVPTDQCDLCAERVGKGKLPTCVKHCQSACMTYGDVAELAQKLGEKSRQVLFVPEQ